MIIRKILVIWLTAVLIITLLAGCEGVLPSRQTPKNPAVGKWHAVIRISDVNGALSSEDRMLLSMLAGDILFDIDAEFFEDGTFVYNMNTEQLQKALSETVDTVLGYFISYDLSVFTDRLIEAALRDGMQSSRRSYSGYYTIADSGLLRAVDGDTILFRMSGDSLVELNEQGDEILRFTRVSEQ